MNMNLNRTVVLFSLVLFAALGQPVPHQGHQIVCGCVNPDLPLKFGAPGPASQPAVHGVDRPV